MQTPVVVFFFITLISLISASMVSSEESLPAQGEQTATASTSNDLDKKNNQSSLSSNINGTGTTAKDPTPKWYFTGTASEEYRFRYATNLNLAEQTANDPAANSQSESDHDMRLFLTGYLWEISDHFAADVSMDFWYDLNGKPATGDPSSHGSISDHNTPQNFHQSYDVYSFYAEYHSNKTLALARGGRQTSLYGRPVTFDGATLKLHIIKPYLDMAFFGGRTVHFFSVNNDLFENWLASSVAIIRPFSTLRIELDYRFTAENTVSQKEITNHSFGLTSWYQLAKWADLKAYVRGQNKAISNAGGGIRLEWTDIEVHGELFGDAQLVSFKEINETNDPYFSILGESLPYLRLRADLWKDFTTPAGIYSIQIGWNERFLTQDDPQLYNRNFGKAGLMLQATDIFINGPFVNAALEYHYTHSNPDINEDSLFALGGSAGFEHDIVKGEIGTYYYKYKYDYYVDLREIEDVRLYYGELRYTPLKWLSVRLKYEFEQFDRDIHTVTLKLAQTY